MDYDRFLDEVRRQAQVDAETAARATQATLETLAERISLGDSRRLAAELPAETVAWIHTDGDPEPLDVHELLRRVAAREGVGPASVEDHARAVFRALRAALADETFDRLVAALPQDFLPLVSNVPMLRVAEFVRRVAERAAVDADRARWATGAVLETLGERIASGDVDDLVSRLPVTLHDLLKRGRSHADARSTRMHADEFVRRVRQRERAPSLEDAVLHARAVLATLRDAVGDAYADVTAQLPPDYALVLPLPASDEHS